VTGAQRGHQRRVVVVIEGNLEDMTSCTSRPISLLFPCLLNEGMPQRPPTKSEGATLSMTTASRAEPQGVVRPPISGKRS